MTRVRIFAALSTAALLAAGCSSGGDRSEAASPGELPGSALWAESESLLELDGTSALAPGQEAVFKLGTLENTSDDPIVIRRIELVNAGSYPHVAELVSAEIAVPRPDGSEVPGGTYLTYPPVHQDLPNAECMVERLVPPAGFLLGPGEMRLTVLRVRAVGPGEARLRQRVVYDRGGRRFAQALTADVLVRVRDKKPRRPRPDERACLALTEKLPTGADSR